MGFRTVVILFNDQTSQWGNDPLLGKKIIEQSSRLSDTRQVDPGSIGYGRVVQCQHADTQTLAVLDNYQLTPLAHSHWYSAQEKNAMVEELLRNAADKLGYRLVKKSKKKS